MRIPAKGATERAALAGKIIGEYQAAQRDVERAEQVQNQLRSIAAQKELAEFNYQIALDREKFHAAMNLETEKRAREWDLEKMEIRSRLDFQEEEKKRQQNLAEFEAGRKIINESNMSEPQKAQALYELEMSKIAGYRVPARREEEEDPLKAFIRQRVEAMSGKTAAQPAVKLGQPISTTEEPTIRKPSIMQRITPLGALSYLLSEKTVQSEIVQENKIRVAAPDGRTGTILINEWPQYEAIGYRRL